jgi:tagaturonate reductase
MKLNKNNCSIVGKEAVTLPAPEIFSLPEKVLQFGTGVLLRGLPNYYIDKANRQGIYNGRVVVVKSTDNGNTNDFDEQDSLYTICVRGIENGKKITENIVSSAISRVLTAGKDWEEILDFASSPTLELIISNTTEVGIQLVEDDVHASPPISYPGKLLAVLFHRYKMYNGSKERGLVIIPTELIPDNATKLKDILLTLAKRNQLPEAFINWMEESNTFCNSLVDRIVPGKPDKTMLAEIENQLGYKDDLLTMSEVYSLWAIEGDEKVRQKLSFAEADNGVVVTPDINLHRELKLRLLNGTHTLSSGVAFLAGFDTVKEAMDNPKMEAFISSLMKSEIANAIPYPVTEEITNDFSNKVLDRFRNPHIKHQWLSITMNYTSKLKMRVVPLVLNYFKKLNTVPELMAFGFAAYINFMQGEEKDGKFYGTANGSSYLINDDKAAYVTDIMKKNADGDIVKAILSDTLLWGEDLSALPGFLKAVNKNLADIKSLTVKKKLGTLEFTSVEA